jgi:N-acetylglucosaminyl-diphospho-decaprenol L-rhamnosyltransferase
MNSGPTGERPTTRRRDSVVVDVVIVAYNSRAQLRSTVEPLVDIPRVRVTVVDNASQDGGLDTLADLPLTAIPLGANGGFSVGCNVGWRAGNAPYVLLLNPDARLDARSLQVLVDLLDEDEGVGLVGPRIVDSSGALDYSQRRFPRLRSTYARALFLHRVMPGASWTDELVRDRPAYEAPRSCDWVSGACMLVRRDVLEALGGLDERFFLYCEDQDLCKRIWDAGYEVRFQPSALCVHDGGASAPRASLVPVAATSRLLYAEKHARRPTVLLERLGLVLNALTHTVVSSGGTAPRAGHVRSLAALVGPPEAHGRAKRRLA